MKDSTLIADLVRAGVDADLIARIVNEIMSACVPDARDAVREYERLRKQNQRKLEQNQRNASGKHDGPAANTDDFVPDIAEDRSSSLSSLLPSLLTLDSKVEKIKEEKKERAKQNRGTVCPDDFVPSESHFEAGAKQNISKQGVEACCEAMRAWSKANSNRAIARKKDWNAALFGWISREAERRTKPVAVPRPGSREDRSERVTHALQKLRNFANGGHSSGEPGGGGDADRPPSLGLSFPKSA